MQKWEGLNENTANIPTALQKVPVSLEQGMSAHPISPSMHH